MTHKPPHVCLVEVLGFWCHALFKHIRKLIHCLFLLSTHCEKPSILSPHTNMASTVSNCPNVRSVVSYCSVCNTNVTGGQQHWNWHVKGRKHRDKATVLKVSEVQPQIAVSTRKLSRNSYAQGQKHLSREAFTRYRSAVAEAEADKHDITVEGNTDFDFVPRNVAQGGIRTEISVRTTQPSTKCTLLEFKLASSQGARVITPG